MKKQAILSITLLMSLAGCKDKQAKPKQVQKNDVFSSVNIPLSGSGSEVDIEEDSAVLSFFDEDLGEFAFADEDDSALVSVADTENDSNEDTRNISWVDTVHEESDLKTIYFGFNKYGVTQDQQDVIKSDIALLQDLLDVIDEEALVVIEGHSCHSAGSAAYNIGLSEKRAKYIRDLFVAAGIDAGRIRVVGRGHEVPALENGKPVTGNREQQAKNRRVEVRIVEAHGTTA